MFEIPRVAGLSDDTTTEDTQRTIFDEPGSQAEAKPVLLPVPEIGPLPPMRPTIVEPSRPKPVVRTPPKVRDADVFGPIPQSFQEAEPPPRDDPDDDVPQAVRKWDRQRDIGLGSGLSLVLVAGAEFFCALLVMAGFATRFAAAPIVFAMAVAVFALHANDPWTMGQGASKEPALLFLVPFLALIFTGAGWLSVDGLVWPWWRARRAKR